jgi:hypothetical protein
VARLILRPPAGNLQGAVGQPQPACAKGRARWRGFESRSGRSATHQPLCKRYAHACLLPKVSPQRHGHSGRGVRGQLRARSERWQCSYAPAAVSPTFKEYAGASGLYSPQRMLRAHLPCHCLCHCNQATEHLRHVWNQLLGASSVHRSAGQFTVNAPLNIVAQERKVGCTLIAPSYCGGSHDTSACDHWSMGCTVSSCSGPSTCRRRGSSTTNFLVTPCRAHGALSKDGLTKSRVRRPHLAAGCHGLLKQRRGLRSARRRLQ